MNEEKITLTTWGNEAQNLCFSVTSTVLQATPIWNTEAEEVPLSPHAAIAIALPHACAQRPRFDTCTCTSVALNSVEERLTSVRWFYFLQFVLIMEDRSYFTDLIPIVVLLDGSIVEPEATDSMV